MVMVMNNRRDVFTYGNDAYTKLLLHFGGDDEATSSTDSSASSHVLTFIGTAQIDTGDFPSIIGSSLLLDGDSDCITTPIDADFNLGTGNFTLDFWTKLSAATTNQWFTIYGDGNNRVYFGFSGEDKPTFLAYVGGAIKASYVTTTYTVSTGSWFHVEWVRNSSTVYLFIDGTSQALTVSTAISTNSIGVADGLATDTVYIGCYAGPTHFINGWMAEVRLSKGIARHTANFTPYQSRYS